MTNIQTDNVNDIYYPYDDEITLLYKASKILETPIRYIIIRKRQPSDTDIVPSDSKYVYNGFYSFVMNMIYDDKLPYDILTEINKYNSTITSDDVVIIYAKYLLDVYDAIGESDLTDEDIEQKSHIVEDLQVLFPTLEKDTLSDNDYVERVRDKYNNWFYTFEAYLSDDVRDADKIIATHKLMSSVKLDNNVKFGNFQPDFKTMIYSPLLNGEPVTYKDGIDIFDKIVTSKFVPYIKYIDSSGKVYTKIYTGENIETAPDYSLIMIPNDRSAYDHIYATIWMGYGDILLKDVTKDSLYIATYNLRSNILTLDTPVGNEGRKLILTDTEDTKERIQKAFTNLVLGESNEYKIKGNFRIWNTSIDESAFLYSMLLDDIISSYLYVEENVKPFALKKRLDIHYKSPFYKDENVGSTSNQVYISNYSSISLTIIQKQTYDNETVEIFDPITKQVSNLNVSKNTNYLQINIFRGESSDIVNKFFIIFRILLQLYKNNEQQIKLIHKNLIPDIDNLATLAEITRFTEKNAEDTIVDRNKKSNIIKSRNSVIDQLTSTAPDLFVTGYARMCQQQPTIVSDEEAARLIKEGKYQVMQFPKNKPNWNFYCNHESSKYPGLKINKLSNKDIYPYYPCCFQTDQMDLNNPNSPYNMYINDIAISQKMGTKTNKKITTKKILSADKIGFLPKAVDRLLMDYSEEYVDMVRYGVEYSPNSFLHCVYVAINDENYMKQTPSQREEIVKNTRKQIALLIKPELLKQELYDYNTNDIKNVLLDLDSFFDPQLLFRAVEEYFNVNIFTFLYENETGEIEIPRYKEFHAHTHNEKRHNILIIKTFGSESDNVKYPQCELIVNYNDVTNEVIKMFGNSVGNICHYALTQTFKTYTWKIPFIKDTLDFDIHLNLYNYVDHMEMFKSLENIQFLSQHIDSNGKMRILSFNYNGILVSIATIPSQPANLPTSNDIYKVNVSDALEIFGVPTALTKDVDGYIDGLWYKVLDIEHCEYVFTSPDSGLDNIPIGPRNPIIYYDISVTDRIRILRRTVNIITEIIRWLYKIEKVFNRTTPELFTEKYVYVDNIAPGKDSVDYYDTRNIVHKLGNFNNVIEAIRYLSKYIPTLCINDKIRLYNETFKKKYIELLHDYDSVKFDVSDIYDQYLNIYTSSIDFKPVLNSQIFTNVEDVNSWLISARDLSNKNANYLIRDTISANLRTIKEPLLYIDDDGKIYIIQNVFGGSKEKAIKVANIWYVYGVNLGSNPLLTDDLETDEEPIHMVYGINEISKIVPIKDMTLNNNVFLRILYYGTRAELNSFKTAHYAAMLEIL